jgi:demethylmenaquinone methyltransferase/2-methoxy-6-polyprenyl-1,4-benzoquinol methylase
LLTVVSPSSRPDTDCGTSPISIKRSARSPRARPGGRLLSSDFNRPANPIVRGAYHAYLTLVGSLLGLALHGDPDTYRYIPESIRNYPGAMAVAGLMTHYGFSEVQVIPVLGGLMAIHIARKPR